MPKTVKEANAAHVALATLITGDRENKYILPSAVRIRLAGSLRKTKPVFEEYGEARTDLIKRLGTKKEDSDSLEVPFTSPNRAEFDSELKKMLAEETDIEEFSPVTKEELFGKEVVDPKTKEKKPENQIDLEVLAGLLEAGIVTE